MASRLVSRVGVAVGAVGRSRASTAGRYAAPIAAAAARGTRPSSTSCRGGTISGWGLSEGAGGMLPRRFSPSLLADGRRSAYTGGPKGLDENIDDDKDPDELAGDWAKEAKANLKAGLEADHPDAPEVEEEGVDVSPDEIAKVMELAARNQKSRGGGGGGRRGGGRDQGEEDNAYNNQHGIKMFEIQETLQLKRTTAVKKGGKLMSFSAIVCCGNGEGGIALGKGKHKEAIKAIENATRRCHKFANVEYFELYDNRTVFHDIETQWKKTKIIMMASKAGMGLRAPEVVRQMCEALGIQDIQVKFHGSRNRTAMIQAFWKALKLQRNPKDVAMMRGMSVVDTSMLRGGYGRGVSSVKDVKKTIQEVRTRLAEQKLED